MPQVQHLDVKSGDVVLFLGTSKGVFLLRSNADRSSWETGGPYFPGHKIYAVAYDGRAGRHRILAGAMNNHWGTVLARSDDFGKSWVTPQEPNVVFPKDSGDALKQIWEIKPANEPNTLYCGVEPAALFISRDAGETWSIVEGLFNHPHRKLWHPGGGGLCLHTIVPHPLDPQKITVAISTGGVYQTTDGGQNWAPRNKGVSAVFVPGEPPEFGQCVHRVVVHPDHPERMFLQNHWGLFRTDNWGQNWVDIGKDFPYTFGFAMAVHPKAPQTVYILPVESDMFRCTPEGKLRVWRSRDAGGTWEPLTNGLPQKDALETVLRHGMNTDPLGGVYFGTESGKVYGSTDSGDSWNEIVHGLPPVLCVRAAVIE